MSETSPTSRHVMLLILIAGLFVAVWSTDSCHTAAPKVQPGSHSQSAIAILMQSTAVEPPTDGVHADGVYGAGIGNETKIACKMVIAHSRLAASTWIARTACGAGEFHSSLFLDEPVAAPLPRQSASQLLLIEPAIVAPIPVAISLDFPVEAPVPVVDAEPIIAPVPATTVPALVNWKKRMSVLNLVARRATVDYRMTCDCCREYCGIAARKVAAVRRQSRQAVADLAKTVSQAVSGIDWEARLSAEPDDGSKRRF